MPMTFRPDPFDSLVRESAARFSRRRFLRVGRDVALLAAAGSLSACGQTPRRRLQETPFGSGIASGDPSASGAVLWTRLDPAVLAPADAADRELAVRWEVATDDGFRRVVQSGEGRALPQLGHSVHVELDGLDPDAWYWYRFDVAGIASPVGRVRTAPEIGRAPERLRFAFASCQHFEHGYYTAYRHMVEEAPDLIVHLGDYMYESRWGTTVPERLGDGSEPHTLEEYRNRYRTYRADPDLQAAHAACPWIVTWDDHEVDNNYAAGVPEDDQSFDAFLERRAAAYQAFYEFMPVRRSSMPSGPDMQLFRRVDFGDLASFHVLDTRQYRSDQACGDGRKAMCAAALDPDRTLLGTAQEEWLAEGLAAAPGQWNVLAQQIRVAEAATVAEGGEDRFSMDMWDGYPAAKRRLLDLLAGSANPVVLTGDIHTHWAAELTRDASDPRSAPVGIELVGSSITSGGDGEHVSELPASLQANAQIRYFENERGYVSVTVEADACRADFRTVPYVTRPDAPLVTRASFVSEAGSRRLERG